MNEKGRLHDYFYDKAYAATGNPVGRVFLRMAAFCYNAFVPVEKVSRTPEEVFQSLGYDPKVFEVVASSPLSDISAGSEVVQEILADAGFATKFPEINNRHMRVFERNLPSLLALTGIMKDLEMMNEAFSPHGDAVAFRGLALRSTDGDDHILLNSERDYRELISSLSGIPKEYLVELKGQANISQAMTLAHEMSHYEMPPTMADKPDRFVEIEGYCDSTPIKAFREASDGYDQQLEDTISELIYARALIPILYMLKDKNELDKSDAVIFGHATALILTNPELAQNEKAGEITIKAYKETREILMRYIDYDAFTPRVIQIYTAAQEALEEENFENPWAEKAIQLFVDGYEYLSPALVEESLKYKSQTHHDQPEL